MSVRCTQVDLDSEDYCALMLRLLGEYSLDPMGGGDDLPQSGGGNAHAPSFVPFLPTQAMAMQLVCACASNHFPRAAPSLLSFLVWVRGFQLAAKGEPAGKAASVAIEEGLEKLPGTLANVMMY